MAVDSADELRRVLGCLPTGVVIAAAYSRDGLVGMAANSITSVSLDPPLISICIAHTSSTWPRIRETGRFCVNILAEHHEETSRRFASRGVDRFAGLSWHDRPGGPALDDAVAWIDCEVTAEHPAGDHTIVVARVIDLKATDDGLALVFFRSRYGGFVPSTAPEKR
ncbi:flavin reductase family protein [Streptomyces sp. NPDC058867]|uniref:flavin reductase family protein n=1 Tax=unclassified Streptomyces TaxID=2593676 RepID=UPI0036B861CE